MRLRQVEVFHAVYTTGSISAAARALHVSQPSVSKTLQHTQQQLGLQLFKLVRQRLVATDEAHALFVEVAEVFERLQSLQVTARNMGSLAKGHIRLAVVPSLGLYVAPQAIVRFRKAHPDITFEVQTLHYDELYQGLYERSCDVAIAYEPPTHPRLKRIDLDIAELMLLYERGSLPVAHKGLPLSVLDGRDVVGLTSRGPLGDLLRKELDRQQINVREVVSNGTFYIAAALTRCGGGMSVVDEFTARASVDELTDAVPFLPALKCKVQCLYLEDRPPSKAVSSFLSTFTKTLREDHARRKKKPSVPAST